MLRDNIAALHELVEDARDADLAIFNSCAVTAEAERDVRKAVRRAASKNAGLRSIVMGCASALPTSRDALAALPADELDELRVLLDPS